MNFLLVVPLLYSNKSLLLESTLVSMYFFIYACENIQFDINIDDSFN